MPLPPGSRRSGPRPSPNKRVFVTRRPVRLVGVAEGYFSRLSGRSCVEIKIGLDCSRRRPHDDICYRARIYYRYVAICFMDFNHR